MKNTQKMSAFVPLSNTLRIGFQFPPSTNQCRDQNNLTTPMQASVYPRVVISRDGGGLLGSGRPDLLDMSWEEYCCLVQSKGLAMNILSFRDYTNSQTDASRRSFGLALQTHYLPTHSSTRFYNANVPTDFNPQSLANNLSYPLPNGNTTFPNLSQPPLPPQASSTHATRFVACPYARTNSTHLSCAVPMMNQASVWNVGGSVRASNYSSRNWPSGTPQTQSRDQPRDYTTTQLQLQRSNSVLQSNGRDSVLNYFCNEVQSQQSVDTSNVSTPAGGRSPANSATTLDVPNTASSALESIFENQIQASQLPNGYHDEVMSEYENGGDETETEADISTNRLPANSEAN